MHNAARLFKKLKERGHRLTKIRTAIVELLMTGADPLSSPALQALLTQRKLPANKTTVYRELAFLEQEGMVRELQFHDGTKRYEITPENHHHHIVCVRCDKIEHVALEENLKQEEKAIAKARNFSVLTHSLEFYGICRGCLRKT